MLRVNAGQEYTLFRYDALPPPDDGPMLPDCYLPRTAGNAATSPGQAMLRLIYAGLAETERRRGYCCCRLFLMPPRRRASVSCRDDTADFRFRASFRADDKIEASTHYLASRLFIAASNFFASLGKPTLID